MDIHTFSRFLHSAAVAGLGFLAAGAYADNLSGAWSLEAYEVAGSAQPGVSGLMVMAEGRFGLIYTMGPDGREPSGRAHFGDYHVSDAEMTFDVEWWPEKVAGKARIVAPVSESAAIRLAGDTLEMLFGSGSVQRWSRIDATGTAEASGTWRLDDVDGRGAAGMLAIADGRFAFVAATDGGKDVAAYGGTVEPLADGLSLPAEWSVAVAGGEGRVSRDELLSLTLKESGAALLGGPDGKEFQLRR